MTEGSRSKTPRTDGGNEYRRVLRAWARKELTRSLSWNHALTGDDVDRVTSVDFEYNEGGPLSEVTYEGSSLYVNITWLDRDGHEHRTSVYNDPGDVGIEMGKLLSELFGIAEREPASTPLPAPSYLAQER